MEKRMETTQWVIQRLVQGSIPLLTLNPKPELTGLLPSTSRTMLDAPSCFLWTAGFSSRSMDYLLVLSREKLRFIGVKEKKRETTRV